MVMWNESQRKAIDTRNKNILISASAGAGKTTVLIARLMKLLSEGIGVDEILAMTFSEAAAAEMKKRLSKELYDQLAKDPKDEFVKKQLANLSSANISTIHGFCLEIMKEYYYVIGLDKKRCDNPLEDGQATALKEKAMEDVLTSYYEHPLFYEMSMMFTTQLDKNGSLEESLISFATLTNAKANPKAFLNTCKQQYKTIEHINELEEDIRIYFYEYFLVKTQLIIELLDTAYEHHQQDGILEKRELYKVALQSLKDQSYTKFREVFMNAMLIKYGVSLSDEYIKEIISLEKEVLAELFEEETYVAYHNAEVEYIHLFCDMSGAYLQTYSDMKQKEGVIDFDDMEHYALDILKADNGYVASLYRKKFKTIMVDEFQDSNDVQDELVRLICSETNVFRVGDIKQSIYGFRHALPSIMKGLIIDKTDNDEVIYLGHNYRSSKMIVDFNNQLFDTLMNVESASSTYSKHDYVIAGTSKQEEMKKPTTLHLLSNELVSEAQLAKKQLKCSYITNLVQQLHNDGLDYKDIVILARGNTQSKELAESLEDVNIPCFYSKSEGFYESDAVQTVLNFLRALCNPYDDIALLSILTSPFFKLQPDDLATIKIEKGEDSFYSYLKDKEYFQVFESLKNNLYDMDLSVLFNEIYTIENYYTTYTTKQEKVNLDMLYEMACGYEKKQAMSVNGFVQYIDTQKEMKVAEAMPIGSNDDVVRIMTIHKSKGLQFKAVILFVADGGLSLQDNKNIAWFDSSLRIGFKYIDKQHHARFMTPVLLAMKHKKQKEMLEEEMRLLYVATTRAQDQMHIVDMDKEKGVKPFQTYAFFKSKNYMDWIMSAFADKNSDVIAYSHIHEMWENEVNKESVETYEGKMYEKSYEQFSLMSPSDTELKAHKPAVFDLHAKDGFERGNVLHKMVELLPNTSWNEEVINTIATKEGFILTQHDMDVLLALSKNSVYASCLKFNHVYHEYPYMIRKDGYVSHGFMDFLAYTDDKVVMIDFKSDRRVDGEELILRYNEQIKAYQEALHILFPSHSIETNIYSFELQKMITII